MKIETTSNASVLVKSGTNITINENDINSRDDTVTIAGGMGNKAYGGGGTNVLTISGGSNNYIKAGVEKDYKSEYEGFDTVNITGGNNNTAEKGFGNVNFYLENGKNNKVLGDTRYYYLEQNIRVNGGVGHSITGGNSIDKLTIYKDSKANSEPARILANLGDSSDVVTIKAGESNIVDGGDGSDIINISNGNKNIAYGGNDGDILTITGGKQNTMLSCNPRI